MKSFMADHHAGSPGAPLPGAIHTPRWIIHVDMDAFYASVEQRDYSEYRGKPVIVGANPQGGKGRGVVSAASYEARKFGIHSAMPISQAYKHCPHGIFLPVRMKRYEEVSAKIFSIFHRYTDLVEPLSLDEAFMDVTGSLRLFGTAQAIGGQILRDITKELSLSASVGVAGTKFMAKVASDLRKPQGFVVVLPGTEADFLKNLPVERLWGAGPKTSKKLRTLGLETIGAISDLTRAEAMTVLGQQGGHLWELAQGHDLREVIPGEPAKSIGAETTFDTDTTDFSVIRQTLLELSERVGQRLRLDELLAGTLTLKFRDETFHTVTRSASIPQRTNQDQVLYQLALSLLKRVPFRGQRVRLLGLSGAKLISSSEISQLSLFDAMHTSESDLTKAVDAVRARFGQGAIQPASLISPASK